MLLSLPYSVPEAEGDMGAGLARALRAAALVVEALEVAVSAEEAVPEAEEARGAGKSVAC